MSEASDLYSPSLYEENAPETFPYPSSDVDFQLINTELSFSQQSTSSNHHSGFLQSPTIPSSLQRVGPNRIKIWILYDAMSKEDYINWWLQTECGSNLGKDNKEKIKWDGAGTHSDIWKHF